MAQLADPWPQYASAHVELDSPSGRLLLRPLPGEQVRPSRTTPQTSWRTLTSLLDVPQDTVLWIVTASDPYPVQLDEVANVARAHELSAALDGGGFVHRSALARSPDHRVSEISRAVIGATRGEVLTIAARFGQLAVFEIADELACVATASTEVMTTRPYVVEPLPVDGE